MICDFIRCVCIVSLCLFLALLLLLLPRMTGRERKPAKKESTDLAQPKEQPVVGIPTHMQAGRQADTQNEAEKLSGKWPNIYNSLSFRIYMNNERTEKISHIKNKYTNTQTQQILFTFDPLVE